LKTLVVDDDFTNRLILQESLKAYGDVHMAANGEEAVSAVRTALERKEHYDLICLDIVMPVMNGHDALGQIRSLEEQNGIALGDGATVMMTTAMDDPANFRSALKGQCDYYLMKPVDISKLMQFLKSANLTH